MIRQIISVLAFTLATEAIRLHCKFGMDSFLSSSDMYTCESTIESVGDFKTVTNIIGQHFPGRNNNDLKGISFVNQFMLEFPLNISNFFPNIESIRVFRTGLTKISRTDVENFQRLKELDLTYNNIQVINNDLFQGNPQVQAIALGLNPLRHVAHHVFDNLPNLSILDVRSTRCVNATTIASLLTVEEVRFEIFRFCPPTAMMLEEDFIASERVQDILRRLDELEATTTIP